MKKLIDKMNPEFAAKLESAKNEFPSTVSDIKKELKKHSFITDLSYGIVISINSLLIKTSPINEFPNIFNQFES